jgi:hypothetical protein
VNLKPDALIERLVPDASEIPDVRVLVGFLGKSTRQGHWRLYLTPTLSEYVEFAQDDVVHSHAFGGDDSRLGGTVVWAKRSANLRHTRTGSREAQADFLQGALSASVSRRGRGHCPGPRVLGWQPQLYHLSSLALNVSCVREFCDFVAATWPSDWSEGVAGCTWEAEC